MADERTGFLKAIGENPLDDVTRKVYADWLDERDETEEADRQRKWVESYHYIKKFADPYAVEEGREPEVLVVLSDLETWKDQIEREGDICFNSNDAQDWLTDEEVKKVFWEHFSVLTGYEVPEELKEQEWYRCAC